MAKRHHAFDFNGRNGRIRCTPLLTGTRFLERFQHERPLRPFGRISLSGFEAENNPNVIGFFGPGRDPVSSAERIKAAHLRGKPEDPVNLQLRDP